MGEDLTRIVECAYQMFKKYRLNGRLDVCTCPSCVSEESYRALLSTSLRNIPLGLLLQYQHSARLVPPNVEEFKYFLPRYLDVIAEGECPSEFGYDIALVRLGEARGQVAWPDEEVALVDRYFLTVLTERLTTAVYPIELGEALCMIAVGGHSMEGITEYCLSHNSTLARTQISAFLCDSSAKLLSKRHFGDSFWRNAPQAMETFIAELLGRQTADYLERAALEDDDPACAQLASFAYEFVDGWMISDSGLSEAD